MTLSMSMTMIRSWHGHRAWDGHGHAAGTQNASQFATLFDFFFAKLAIHGLHY